MKYVIKTLATIVLTALLIVFSMQLVTYIWDFYDAIPFTGDSIYNPYQGISADMPYSKTFSKSNFHAHTCFDTREKYTTEDLIEAYKAQDYKNIGITDHQYINPQGIIPSYEHGYGLNNFHIGMYDAKSVDWIDNVFMFIPKHQIQSSFHRLKDKCEILTFNHSDRLRLMLDTTIECIREYDLFELYPTERRDIWDRVLSSGYYVPLVANDDAHSITNRNSQFQRAFTMVYNGDNSPYYALLRGHSYGVTVSNSRNKNGHHGIPRIDKIDLTDNILTIELDSLADSIKFIGQSGKTLEKAENTDSASYCITRNDTYVRIESYFDGIKMYTNPVARTHKNGFAQTVPSINWILSIINWIFWLVIIYLDIILMIKLWRKHKGRGENYYHRHKHSRHYENRVIGAGLKSVEWN